MEPMNKLIAGDIYLRYKEKNALTLTNAYPSITYDESKKFEFEITGKNTTTNKNIWYDIVVSRGEVPDGKLETNRIDDRFIKFTLTEQIDNGPVVTVVDSESWENLTNGKKIWVDTIKKNQLAETTHKYTLYMWLSDKIVIGNEINSDYSISAWNNAFASIKVSVNGDFTKKYVDEPIYTINAMGTFPSVITNQKTNIKEIYFNKMNDNTMQNRYDAASIKADITYNNEGRVLTWLEEDTLDNTKYIMYVVSNSYTYLTTGASLFQGFTNASKIEFNNIDTSRVTNMSSMFNGCSSLTNLDVSMFDTFNVTDMAFLFRGCTNLENIQFTTRPSEDEPTYVSIMLWDTSNVQYMNSMFYDCSSLTELNLSAFITDNVIDMTCIFYNCINLKNITLSGWGNSDKLASVNNMFGGCTSLQTIHMNSFNFGHAYTRNLFSGLTSLQTLDLRDADTSNVVYMNEMFSYCSSLVNLDLSSFDMSKVIDISNIFSGCTNLKTIDLSGVSTINCNIYNMFAGLSALEKIYVSDSWNMTDQPDYMPIFTGCTSLVGGNGTHYDSGKVDKTMAVIDTEGHEGYLTHINNKNTN